MPDQVVIMSPNMAFKNVNEALGSLTDIPGLDLNHPPLKPPIPLKPTAALQVAAKTEKAEIVAKLLNREFQKRYLMHALPPQFAAILEKAALDMGAPMEAVHVSSPKAQTIYNPSNTLIRSSSIKRGDALSDGGYNAVTQSKNTPDFVDLDPSVHHEGYDTDGTTLDLVIDATLDAASHFARSSKEPFTFALLAANGYALVHADIPQGPGPLHPYVVGGSKIVELNNGHPARPYEKKMSGATARGSSFEKYSIKNNETHGIIFSSNVHLAGATKKYEQIDKDAFYDNDPKHHHGPQFWLAHPPKLKDMPTNPELLYYALSFLESDESLADSGERAFTQDKLDSTREWINQQIQEHGIESNPRPLGLDGAPKADPAKLPDFYQDEPFDFLKNLADAK